MILALPIWCSDAFCRFLVVPLVVQNGAVGGADGVLVLPATSLEFDLVLQAAVVPVPLDLQVIDLVPGDPGVVQGGGQGGLSADVRGSAAGPGLGRLF